MQLERLGMHDRQSHVTPPRRALMDSIQDENGPPEPDDSDDDEEVEDDEDSEDEDCEDDDDEDENDDDADDDDSGNDRAQVSADEAQYPGMLPIVEFGFSRCKLMLSFCCRSGCGRHALSSFNCSYVECTKARG